MRIGIARGVVCRYGVNDLLRDLCSTWAVEIDKGAAVKRSSQRGKILAMTPQMFRDRLRLCVHSWRRSKAEMEEAARHILAAHFLRLMC